MSAATEFLCSMCHACSSSRSCVTYPRQAKTAPIPSAAIFTWTDSTTRSRFAYYNEPNWGYTIKSGGRCDYDFNMVLVYFDDRSVQSRAETGFGALVPSFGNERK
jgi:hypothetical protein